MLLLRTERFLPAGSASRTGTSTMQAQQQSERKLTYRLINTLRCLRCLCAINTTVTASSRESRHADSSAVTRRTRPSEGAVEAAGSTAT